ncbi:MAG: hypothetical protein ACI4KH_03125, partial [Oscillospiraceae bacterium]
MQIRNDALIVYTSADSVLQIAAHEDIVPIDELYDICQKVSKITSSEKYNINEECGIKCIACAPLAVNGEIIGLLGLDNPQCNTKHLLLLSVIASACCSELANKHLETSHKELSERIKIIQSLSEIYTSVYYIDIPNNHFVELASVETVYDKIGHSGNAKETLEVFCHNLMAPEYTEEMLEFVNLSTLDERMKKSRIVSKQYLSSVKLSPEQKEKYNWTQCSFIEGDRDAEGKLSHVIFATQSIQESKVKELEAQRKIQNANTELTSLLKTEKQNTAIIGSLSSIFFALYLIDLNEKTFQEILSPDSTHHIYGEKGEAKICLKNAIGPYVNEEYKSIMRIFIDIDTIDERLGDKSIITQEFLSPDGDWIRCSIIPVEKDDSEKNIRVIFGLRNINSERERLKSQDNLIQALSMSYENVYAVNIDTAKAVCYRMDRTINARYGQEFAIGDYDANIRLYVENDVFEDDRYLFDKIMSVKKIKALLSDKNTYYFNYRVFRNGIISYFQCQLVKPDIKRNEFAIGFKNIDEEKKQELAQQKKIEDALAGVEKANKKLQYEMAIAGTLSKDYPDVVLLDLANDTATTIKRNGYIIEEDKRIVRRSYNDTWESYISKYVIDEDKER